MSVPAKGSSGFGEDSSLRNGVTNIIHELSHGLERPRCVTKIADGLLIGKRHILFHPLRHRRPDVSIARVKPRYRGRQLEYREGNAHEARRSPGCRENSFDHFTVGKD